MQQSRKIISVIILLFHIATIGEGADFHSTIFLHGTDFLSHTVVTDHHDAAHCHHKPIPYHKEGVLCPLCASSMFFTAVTFSFDSINQTGIFVSHERCIAHRMTFIHAYPHRGPPIA